MNKLNNALKPNNSFLIASLVPHSVLGVTHEPFLRLANSFIEYPTIGLLEQDLDTIVGNSPTTGWSNTATKWLTSIEGKETIEEIRDTTQNTTFLATGISLLDRQPDKRPSAKQVRDILSIYHLPSLRPQTA